MVANIKKVFIVFNSLDIGGIERKIVDFSNDYTSDKNIHLTILLKHHRGQLLSHIPKPVTILTPAKSWMFPLWLIWIFLRFSPNLVLTFGNYCGVLSVIAKILSLRSTPVIISEDSSVTTQISSDTYPLIRRLFVKISYPFATKIITLTSAGQQKLASLIPRAKNKIVVLPNWLPLSFKTNLSKSLKSVDIVFLGRFEPQKNPLLFLKICRKIIKLQPSTTVEMYGQGSLESQIKQYIHTHHLSQNIKLFPATTSVEPIFQKSQILLLASTHEGFPLTILEAMASNCLPICKSIGEIISYFDLMPQSLLYKNSATATTKVMTILNNQKLHKKLSVHYRRKTINSQANNFQKTVNLTYQYL